MLPEVRPATFRRSVAEHQAEVRSLLAGLPGALGAETVPIAAALGRTLAADLAAPRPLPPFANSQMDGYAVRAADLSTGPVPWATLPVAPPIPAGAAAPPLPPGHAAPIMTGAMLPAGADTVVPIEAADPPAFPDFVGGGNPYRAGTTVTLPASFTAGTYVRPAGSDLPAGETALAGGTRLGAAQLGLAAGLGLDRLAVRRRPRALVLSTGDEVAAPGTELAPGQIHDANTTLLTASLAQAGWDTATAGICADNAPAFGAALAGALAAAGIDLVLTSGGISQGAYEVVRQALADHGIAFGSVAMQPGGPQGAGLLALPGTAPVPLLAFPGNPVSSFVSFEVFLRPVLCELLGTTPRPQVSAPLAVDLDKPAGKLQVRRGILEDGRFLPLGGPGSHLLHALAQATALALLPAGPGHLDAGTDVPVLTMGDPQ